MTAEIPPTDVPDLSVMPDMTGMPDNEDVPKEPDMSMVPGSSGSSITSEMSVGEAAARLGVSERQVRRYIRAGRLRAYRKTGSHGVEYRVDVDSVERLRGERAAIEMEFTATDAADALDVPDRPVGPPITSVSPASVQIQALIDGITSRLDALYQEQLATKDAVIATKDELIEELRQRAEAAERERADLVRQLTERPTVMPERRGVLARLFRRRKDRNHDRW